MLGSPILYLKGMRILMFQLSGFYYIIVTTDFEQNLRGRAPRAGSYANLLSGFRFSDVGLMGWSAPMETLNSPCRGLKM